MCKIMKEEWRLEMRKNVGKKTRQAENHLWRLNKVMHGRVESVLRTCGKITNYA